MNNINLELGQKNLTFFQKILDVVIFLVTKVFRIFLMWHVSSQIIIDLNQQISTGFLTSTLTTHHLNILAVRQVIFLYFLTSIEKNLSQKDSRMGKIFFDKYKKIFLSCQILLSKTSLQSGVDGLYNGVLECKIRYLHYIFFSREVWI